MRIGLGDFSEDGSHLDVTARRLRRLRQLYSLAEQVANDPVLWHVTFYVEYVIYY